MKVGTFVRIQHCYMLYFLLNQLVFHSLDILVIDLAPCFTYCKVNACPSVLSELFLSLGTGLLENIHFMRPGPQGAGHIKFFSFIIIIVLRGHFGLFVLISQNWASFKQIEPYKSV